MKKFQLKILIIELLQKYFFSFKLSTGDNAAFDGFAINSNDKKNLNKKNLFILI